MLSVQVVVPDKHTSYEHAVLPLHFGVLCVLVRAGRSVAPVLFQLLLHVLFVTIAMSR